MIRLLIKKELKEYFRSAGLTWIFAGTFLLIILAAFNGYTYYSNHHKLLTDAQYTSYQQFINQGNKDPHTGAHFGFYAFKPSPEMAIFESGVDDFTGTSFYLEPHKRGTVKFKQVVDATGLKRFGFLTIGYFTQFILPLFIFIKCYHIFAKEWENGTIKILLCTNIKSKQLFFGKLLACLTIISIVILFIAVLSLLLLIISGQDILAGDAFLNVTIYLSSISLFATMLTIMGVCSSIFFRNSSIALIVLCGFWLIGAFLLPRASSELAKNIFPSITSMSFDNSAERLKMEGLNGQGSRDERREKLIAATLVQYHVKRLEDLPVNFIPISIEFFEESDAEIMNGLYTAIDENFEKQNHFVALSMILSPFNAFKDISMSICGTDMFTHRDFTLKAEAHRMLIQELVDAYYVKHTTAGKDFWKTIPQFSYEPPTIWTRLIHQKIQLFTLLGWLVFSVLLMISAIKKIKV